jgi:hypothetical protein
MALSHDAAVIKTSSLHSKILFTRLLLLRSRESVRKYVSDHCCLGACLCEIFHVHHTHTHIHMFILYINNLKYKVYVNDVQNLIFRFIKNTLPIDKVFNL